MLRFSLPSVCKNVVLCLCGHREWYSYHFPELVKLVPDNYMYARTAKLIGSRKEFTEDKLEKLEEIVMDSTKAEAIFEAAKVSMGE